MSHVPFDTSNAFKTEKTPFSLPKSGVFNAPDGSDLSPKDENLNTQKFSKGNIKKRQLFGVGERSKPMRHSGDPEGNIQRYPEDPYGEEMNSGARLWRVYLDEAGRLNTELIEEWKENLDVLLVFAGLFSAVVTTIVTESANNLKPDREEAISSLLAESVFLQRAIASGVALEGIDVTPIQLPPFVPTITDKWINGLWFLSLTFSLITALFAVLSKQWLQHFQSSIPGTARDRARVTQSRRDALDDWHVGTIISILPLLLHASLFIFFAGLVLFLLDLCKEIGAIVSVVVGLTLISYTIATILPLRYPRCPYVAPLSNLANKILESAYSLQLQLRIALTMSAESETRSIASIFLQPKAKRPIQSRPSLVILERKEIQEVAHVADARVLIWLHLSCSSNPTINAIVLQAIAGLHPQFTQHKMLVEAGLDTHLPKPLQLNDGHNLYESIHAVRKYVATTSSTTAERFMRASLQLRRHDLGGDNGGNLQIEHHWMMVVAFHPHIDANAEKIVTSHPSFCIAQSALNLCQFLSDSTLCLHPIMWERLLLTAGYAIHNSKRHLPEKDLEHFRWTLGLKFFEAVAPNTKALLSIGQDTEVILDDPKQEHGEAISIAQFARTDLWLYFLSSFNVPKEFSQQSFSSSLNLKELYRSRPILMLTLALDLLDLSTKITSIGQQYTGIQSTIRFISRYASAFIRGDKLRLIADGHTAEYTWLNQLPDVERTVETSKRKRLYLELIQRSIICQRNIVCDSLFMDKEGDERRGDQLKTWIVLDDILAELEKAGIKVSLPPLKSAIVLNLARNLLEHSNWASWSDFSDHEFILIRLFESGNNEALEKFIGVDGIQLVFNKLSALLDNKRDGYISSSLTGAVAIMDAIIRASLSFESAKTYIMKGVNLTLACRVFFLSLIHLDRFGKEVDELSMPIYWPRGLFCLARLTAASSSLEWKTALAAVTQQTPRNYEDVRLTKDYFRLVEELRYAAGIEDTDKCLIKQWVYIRQDDMKNLSITCPIHSLVSDAPRIQVQDTSYVQAEYSNISDYLTIDLRVQVPPLNGIQAADPDTPPISNQPFDNGWPLDTPKKRGWLWRLLRRDEQLKIRAHV